MAIAAETGKLFIRASIRTTRTFSLPSWRRGPSPRCCAGVGCARSDAAGARDDLPRFGSTRTVRVEGAVGLASPPHGLRRRQGGAGCRGLSTSWAGARWLPVAAARPRFAGPLPALQVPLVSDSLRTSSCSPLAARLPARRSCFAAAAGSGGLHGRFFWDEFDLLLVTTFARACCSRKLRRAKRRACESALALLALSVVASIAIALWPPTRSTPTPSPTI